MIVIKQCLSHDSSQRGALFCYDGVMKWLMTLLAIATVGCAFWTIITWQACGFFVFDSFYLNFNDEALKHPKFYTEFETTCRRVFFRGIGPIWILCIAWMAVAITVILRCTKNNS